MEINMKKNLYAWILAAGLISFPVHAATHEIDLTGEDSYWTIMMYNDNGVDKLLLIGHSYTYVYSMSQADVTPTEFILTYNTIKEAIMTSSSNTLRIHHNGAGKLLAVQYRYGSP